MKKTELNARELVKVFNKDVDEYLEMEDFAVSNIIEKDVSFPLDYRPNMSYMEKIHKFNKL